MQMNRVVTLILVVGWSFGVEAGPQPQSFDFGAGKVIPMLKVSQKQDDNIYSQATNEQSDTVTLVSPVVQFQAQKDSDSYAVTYSGDFGKYWDNSRDNFDDHTLSFDALLSPNDYYTIDVGASVARLHEGRGEGSSEGINALQRPEPDEYDLSDINAVLDLGRDSAKVGVELEAQRTDQEYTNNQSETRYRDRVSTQLGARVYTKLSGKTRVFFGLSQQDFAYDELPLFGPTLDSENQKWFVGARWEVTGKTSGEVRVGNLDKDFDASTRSDDDFGFWTASVTWSPKSYSVINFTANNDARETNGTGAYIESRDFSVSWQHAWSQRLRSTVSLNDGSDSYQGSPRSDDRTDLSFGIDYDWQRWMNIGARYQFSDRESNQNQFDYDKNVFLVNVNLSL